MSIIRSPRREVITFIMLQKVDTGDLAIPILVPRDAEGNLLNYTDWRDIVGKIENLYLAHFLGWVEWVDQEFQISVGITAHVDNEDEELTQWTGIQPIEREPASRRAGYIYLLSGDHYYKIGLTTRKVMDRVGEFSPKLPFEVEIIHSIKVDDVYAAEEYLHQRFADKRSNGEWFELSKEDVAWIKGWDGSHETL